MSRIQLAYAFIVIAIIIVVIGLLQGKVDFGYITAILWASFLIMEMKSND